MFSAVFSPRSAFSAAVVVLSAVTVSGSVGVSGVLFYFRVT